MFLTTRNTIVSSKHDTLYNTFYRNSVTLELKCREPLVTTRFPGQPRRYLTHYPQVISRNKLIDYSRRWALGFIGI